MQRWFILFLILISSSAEAQYYNEQVLEKSFEQMDFFGQPSFVNPYGIGGFGVVAYGLIDDPLLNLKINPAYTASDSLARRYTYLNFRSTHEIEQSGSFYPCYDYEMSYSDIYFPGYYIESRKALEPAFTAATLFRPGNRTSGLTFGMSYQLILQDEAYYQIPQDIYRPNVGADYEGGQMADTGDIPIVDRYSGEDGLHHEGHFLNLTAALPLTDTVNLGARLGRVTFSRDGTYGSQNLWDGSYYQDGESSRSYLQSREQNYDHWDVSGGLNIKLSEITTVGVSGGCLWGDALQNRVNEDNSHYLHGTIDQGDNWSLYDRASTSDQSWNHDGTSIYGGANLETKINPEQTFTLYYRYTKQDNDLRLSSSIADTSYSNYHHEYNDWQYGAEHTSALVDSRTGTGQSSKDSHIAAAALRWQIDQRTRLHLGATLTHSVRQTNTNEAVYSRRFSERDWSNQSSTDYRYRATEERKDLLWDFRASQTAFHLPIILTYQATSSIELQFGVKRTMRRWQINDSTLALFDYRIETDEDGSGTEQDFGERYTQPEEKRSDVTTTMITGMTVKPADHLEVRFLIVPNFENRWDGTELTDIQWWIDFRLF